MLALLLPRIYLYSLRIKNKKRLSNMNQELRKRDKGIRLRVKTSRIRDLNAVLYTM